MDFSLRNNQKYPPMQNNNFYLVWWVVVLSVVAIISKYNPLILICLIANIYIIYTAIMIFVNQRNNKKDIEIG